MEHAFRQLQFHRRFLTAFRTGLTRMVRWHLMEVFTITFCHPVAPVKEHTPSRVRDRLSKVSVLYHVAWLEFLRNNGIKFFVVKKFVDGFGDKVKALARNNIRLFCQCVFRFIPPSTPILLARKVAVKFYEFAFRLSVKARVRNGVAIGIREKLLCPNVYTTSRLRDTRHRIRHFANDKAIPAACRLFHRDLFRVSDKWTVHSDFDFTELRHFQPVKPCTCFTDRLLTDAFTRLNFVFSQTPRKRTDRTLKLRIPFLFRFRVFASAKEVINRRVYTFDCLNLHILWVLAIMRVFAEFRKVVYLVILGHRDTAIIPHLRTHLEHVVLEFLLVFQLRKKPLLLRLCRIYRIFKGLFHKTIAYRPLTPIQWVGGHVTKW